MQISSQLHGSITVFKLAIGSQWVQSPRHGDPIITPTCAQRSPPEMAPRAAGGGKPRALGCKQELLGPSAAAAQQLLARGDRRDPMARRRRRRLLLARRARIALGTATQYTHINDSPPPPPPPRDPATLAGRSL
jgi:hypothetical protein